MSEETCLIDWSKGPTHCETHKRTLLECAHAFRRLVTHERAENNSFLEDIKTQLLAVHERVDSLRAERDLFQYLTRELTAKVVEQRDRIERQHDAIEHSLRLDDINDRLIQCLEEQIEHMEGLARMDSADFEEQVQHNEKLEQENKELRAMMGAAASRLFDWLKAHPDVEVQEQRDIHIVQPEVLGEVDLQRLSEELGVDPRPTDNGELN